MKPTWWLASYPKSGNTWFRVWLANLTREDGPVDINRLDSIDTIASARPGFDAGLFIDSGLLTDQEIDDLRPAYHRHAAVTRAMPGADPASAPARFVKTHDAYGVTRSGEALLGGAAAAAGALLFVRDPRDVAPSFAHHIGLEIGIAISLMGLADYGLGHDPRTQPVQLRQRMLGWSGFIASWLDQPDLPVHLIRYEDMHRDPVATLRGALDAIGWAASDAAIARAVRFSSFDEMQRQERKAGFREAPAGRPDFFRRGVAGGWRDTLSPAQVARIESDHGAMMKRLGYESAAG